MFISEWKSCSPEHCLNLERWQGPPQCETVSSFKVSLFIQSWKQRGLVYLVCQWRSFSSESNSSLKLRSAPLRCHIQTPTLASYTQQQYNPIIITIQKCGDRDNRKKKAALFACLCAWWHFLIPTCPFKLLVVTQTHTHTHISTQFSDEISQR